MSQQLITVATFLYSTEANIIKGRLASEGVVSYLFDDITIDTDPLVSNAIGGVKLKVDKVDETKAKEILSSISDYSLDNTGSAIQCPNCGAEKIHYFSSISSIKSLMAFLVGSLFSALPFYTKYSYSCEVCKVKFNLVENQLD